MTEENAAGHHSLTNNTAAAAAIPEHEHFKFPAQPRRVPFDVPFVHRK
jgi:hypothetical protein